ncbi:hypothetical protein KCP75_25820 [Salmonella enterica subsp. enterica]|nr:hypothetical protein KCP75_25820 [Salmonella enterica subsp. enterica]
MQHDGSHALANFRFYWLSCEQRQRVFVPESLAVLRNTEAFYTHSVRFADDCASSPCRALSAHAGLAIRLPSRCV